MITEHNGTSVVLMTSEEWMRIRQAHIISLGAIEDALEIPRSIVPRHRRQHRKVVPALRTTKELRDDLR